ncbi:glutathione S-transferase theta-2-like [Malaya genurostris]|uniref:glutathione S-transferase theta-2-like n=1 Tax=Malaya genurostris TaxID=325434 RepID=UPI0026F3BB1B|nr:glutathione S-transferase theta-2-like [Malaya genurostris]
MATKVLKYYYDLLSQPSRALYILLEQSKISHEKCPIALRKLENRTKEFIESISRFGKVPCIVHGDFKLAENIAIFRYLDREFGFGEQNWYPKDRVIRARVDEYLEWQHANLRAQCTLYFMYVWLGPLKGMDVDPDKSLRLRDNMIKCLHQFEIEWLEEGRKPFLTGQDMTYADLLAACEIEQTKITGFDARAGRPHLAAWLERVRNRTNPFYDQAHRIIYKLTPEEIDTPNVD